MTKDPQDLSKGDQVSWNWGSGNPKGKVQEVVEGGLEATTTTKNGNEIKAKGDEENPAVVIKANSGSNAIKKASELNGVDA